MTFRLTGAVCLLSLLVAGCTAPGSPSNLPPAGAGDIKMYASPGNQVVGAWKDTTLTLVYENTAEQDLSFCGTSVVGLRVNVTGPDGKRWTGAPRTTSADPCPEPNVILSGLPRSVAVDFLRFSFEANGTESSPQDPGLYMVVVSHPMYHSAAGPVNVTLARAVG